MLVNRKAFVTELEWVTRFVESKTTIPILNNVLINVADGAVRLTATDLELGGITETPAVTTPEESWSITTPARQLLKYLKRVTDQAVCFAHSAAGLKLTHGAESEVNLTFMDADSYPVLPSIEPTRELSGLLEALPRVEFAISAEQSRFTLNGALFEVRDGAGRMVATDGHRLSYVSVEAGPDPFRALIPRAALTELAKLKADSVYFGSDEDHLVFLTKNGRRIITRKLTGTFPDYERVMPQHFDHSVMLPVDETAAAIDRVSLFACERGKGIKVSVSGGRLVVEASTVEGGAARAAVPCATNGTIWQTGLNWQYLAEFLKLAPEAVSFQFSEPTPAAIEKWKAEGESGPAPDNSGPVEFSASNWRYVVMPMRI